MQTDAVDPAYLAYQYTDSTKLRIRAETHQRYTMYPSSAGPIEGDPFIDGLLRHLRLQRAGLRLLDVGCGPGTLHARLQREHGAWVVGVDTSLGMLAEARQQRAGRYAQADAQALPLVDAAFDRVMANHMLFHVPDQDQALREMRRVLRPGGRLVLTTNGPSFMLRFDEVHAGAARSLGYVPTPSIGLRFTLADLDLVRRTFPEAERHVLESELVFPEAEPALRYYASSMVDRIADRPTDSSHRARLLPLVRDRIVAIIAAEGAFRLSKSVGWFTADV